MCFDLNNNNDINNNTNYSAPDHNSLNWFKARVEAGGGGGGRCLREGGVWNKNKHTQKQCTNTYDEQETHVTVGLFNRQSVGEQECSEAGTPPPWPRCRCEPVDLGGKVEFRF